MVYVCPVSENLPTSFTVIAKIKHLKSHFGLPTSLASLCHRTMKQSSLRNPQQISKRNPAKIIAPKNQSTKAECCITLHDVATMEY